MNCYCGLPKEFSKCCLPIITNRTAETAETLMRSRYSAYVIKDADYLYETTFPSKRDENVKDKTSFLSDEVTFFKLEVLHSNFDTVEFIAYFKLDGHLQKHHEISKFKQLNHQWFYYDHE